MPEDNMCEDDSGIDQEGSGSGEGEPIEEEFAGTTEIERSSDDLVRGGGLLWKGFASRTELFRITADLVVTAGGDDAPRGESDEEEEDQDDGGGVVELDQGGLGGGRIDLEQIHGGKLNETPAGKRKKD